MAGEKIWILKIGRLVANRVKHWIDPAADREAFQLI